MHLLQDPLQKKQEMKVLVMTKIKWAWPAEEAWPVLYNYLKSNQGIHVHCNTTCTYYMYKIHVHTVYMYMYVCVTVFVCVHTEYCTGISSETFLSNCTISCTIIAINFTGKDYSFFARTNMINACKISDRCFVS